MRNILKTYKMVYRSDKLAVILQFPMAFIKTFQQYFALFITGYILNGFVAGTEFSQLLRVALIFVGVRFALGILDRYLSRIHEARNEYAVSKIYLNKAKKYMEVDFELLDSPAIAEINNRMRIDNNWGNGFYNSAGYLRAMLEAVFGLIMGAVVMIPLFISSGVGGVALLLGGLFLFSIVSSWFSSKFFKSKRTELMQMASDKYNMRFSNFFLWGRNNRDMAKTVRIYNAGQHIKDKIMDEKPIADEFSKKFTKYQAGDSLTATVSSAFFLVGGYLFVAARATAQIIPVGDIVFFAGAITTMAQSFFELADYWTGMVDQCNRVQSMMDFMELENKQYKGTLPVEKRRDGEYEIEFKNVSFKYSGSKNYALRNFNLKLRVGQKLAIVGMNGSGKTTMIKLLTRLYDPTEGEITLNGINIKKYNYKEYMGIFSVVFQDFKIFSFTMADNLASGAEFEPSAAKLAVERVGLGERVAKMPDGLGTYMYNDYDAGVEISGGEGQKLALARALYKNAPIFVLDEPTAALDPISEFEVYSLFNEVIQVNEENTAIFISHRLSSCRFCDDIAVFHEGELVQRGNHDNLLGDRRGKYHELWNAQAQYYNEETA